MLNCLSYDDLKLNPYGGIRAITVLHFLGSVCFLVALPAKTMSLSQSEDNSPPRDDSLSTVRINKRKALSQIKPMTAMSVINKIYSLVVCNTFELVWVERSEGQDSNTFPFFASVRDGGTFARVHGVIMMANRRVSFESEQAMRNNEDNYMRRYYVRIIENNDFNQQRRLEFLVDLADVSEVLNVYCVASIW